MKISKEECKTETVVATLSKDELTEIMKKAAMKTIIECGDGDGVISSFLTVATAFMAVEIKTIIFNNKEDKYHGMDF